MKKLTVTVYGEEIENLVAGLGRVVYLLEHDYVAGHDGEINQWVAYFDVASAAPQSAGKTLEKKLSPSKNRKGKR